MQQVIDTVVFFISHWGAPALSTRKTDHSSFKKFKILIPSFK
jgi:hypothetical protein